MGAKLKKNYKVYELLQKVSTSEKYNYDFCQRKTIESTGTSQQTRN